MTTWRHSNNFKVKTPDTITISILRILRCWGGNQYYIHSVFCSKKAVKRKYSIRLLYLHNNFLNSRYFLNDMFIKMLYSKLTIGLKYLCNYRTCPFCTTSRLISSFRWNLVHEGNHLSGSLKSRQYFLFRNQKKFIKWQSIVVILLWKPSVAKCTLTIFIVVRAAPVIFSLTSIVFQNVQFSLDYHMYKLEI